VDAIDFQKDNPIIEGCNYHTTWQSNKDMRFVLYKVYGSLAILNTRTTRKVIKTDVSTLIFIKSNHNINKAKELLKGNIYV